MNKHGRFSVARPTAVPSERSGFACSVISLARARTGFPFSFITSGARASESKYSSPWSLYIAFRGTELWAVFGDLLVTCHCNASSVLHPFPNVLVELRPFGYAEMAYRQHDWSAAIGPRCRGEPHVIQFLIPLSDLGLRWRMRSSCLICFNTDRSLTCRFLYSNETRFLFWSTLCSDIPGFSQLFVNVMTLSPVILQICCLMPAIYCSN
jgi:hypothetical protein